MATGTLARPTESWSGRQMSGARRARLVALAVAALLSVPVMVAPAVAGPLDPCSPDNDTSTTLPTCVSTSTTATTIATTTSTTVVQTTTTQRQVVTTEEPAPETTTTLEVTTSQDLLVPGDGTEGAESTTTTATPTRISNEGTSDGTLLALIVGGLVLLALVVSVLTWRYWVATRPPRTPTVGSRHG